MTSRRTVIAGGAGAAVLAALGYRAWDRGVFVSGEGPAYEAWQDWEGKGDTPVRRPLHAAILASSAHNTQPWLFEPHEDSITVYADLSRNLGAADPFRRELYVSIGCAVSNALLIHGVHGEVAPLEIFDRTLTPDVPLSAVKAISLAVGRQNILTERTSAHAEMRAAIPRRHTNRGPYVPDRVVTTEQAGRIYLSCYPYAAVKLVNASGAKKELGALIVEATERFIADRQMSADSARYFRTGRREIEASRTGISSDTAGLSPLMNTLAKLMPDQDAATADKYWLASTQEVQVPTAACFGVILAGNRLTAREAMFTGMAWQQLHLTATALGLAAQPMNQPIEMMDRDLLLGRKNDYAREIRRIAGVTEGDPAFIFRLGYAERPALPSPRRRLEDVIKKA